MRGRIKVVGAALGKAWARGTLATPPPSSASVSYVCLGVYLKRLVINWNRKKGAEEHQNHDDENIEKI